MKCHIKLKSTVQNWSNLAQIWKKKLHKSETNSSKMIKFCSNCLKKIAICCELCYKSITKRFMWLYRHQKRGDAPCICFQEKSRIKLKLIVQIWRKCLTKKTAQKGSNLAQTSNLDHVLNLKYTCWASCFPFFLF